MTTTTEEEPINDELMSKLYKIALSILFTITILWLIYGFEWDA